MIRLKVEGIQKEAVEPYFEQWEVLSTTIHGAHHRRAKEEAQSLMQQGIGLFEECVLHCSEIDGESEMNVHEQYEVLPINGMERFLFIKARPGQYACYRQLDELFKELKKRLARLRIKK